MIKNKTLDIKFIFKTNLKILKIALKHFRFLQIFKNYSQKIFFKIIF